MRQARWGISSNGWEARELWQNKERNTSNAGERRERVWEWDRPGAGTRAQCPVELWKHTTHLHAHCSSQNGRNEVQHAAIRVHGAQLQRMSSVCSSWRRRRIEWSSRPSPPMLPQEAAESRSAYQRSCWLLRRRCRRRKRQARQQTSRAVQPLNQ